MTKEQFEEWKAHPVTIEVFKEVKKTKAGLEDCLINGMALCDSADETQAHTARMVGNIEGLNQILNISYQDEGE